MFALLVANTINAQDLIKGRVSDASGNPIPYANIQVLNSIIGTATNKDGNFEIQLPASARILKISAIGYATRTHTIGGETNLAIVLIDAAEQLNDVVVTAQKREEKLVEIPISVSSLNAEKVTDTRTWGLSGLTALVPNYLYQEAGVGFQAIQSIRGIQVFSENPAVGTYVDDVNSLDILANGFALNDIERIEVLRGPQGTLFGRNTMGGVINITTKQPTAKTSGFVEIGAGNLNLQRHSFAIKTPLSKHLFFGVNGLYQDREGFWENDASLALEPDPTLDGKTVGDERNLYGNFYLKWLPSERFWTTLNVKIQQDRSDASGFFVSQPNETVAFENPDKIYLSRIGQHERTIVNSSLSLKYMANKVNLTAISTYQRIGLSFQDIDFPGFYHSFFDDEIGEKLPPQEVFSQEFRAQSANDGKLQYTAGAYGFTQVGYEPTTNLAFETGPESYAVFRNRSDNRGIALFGEVRYAFTKVLELTAGLRYDDERREARFNGFGDAVFENGMVVNNVPDTTLIGNYNALSPKLALSYLIGKNSSVYGSYNRGFRAGGINAQRLPDRVAQTFNPEFSNNYEIGYKIAKKRWSLRSSFFYIDWTDIQFFNLVAPFTFARENVGSASSLGLELEIAAVPLKGLQLDASVGLTETEYRDFELIRVDFTTGEESVTQISGNSLSNAPGHTLFLGAQFTQPLSKEFTLVTRGEFRNIGRFYTDIQNDLEQPAYSLVNARLGVTFKKYSLFLWGQNLTDTTYLSFGAPDTSFSRTTRSAAPATYGLTLTANF